MESEKFGIPDSSNEGQKNTADEKGATENKEGVAEPANKSQERLEKERLESQIADWEQRGASLENKEECGPMLAEVKDLISSFEDTHDLDALHAIKILTMKTAPNYPERESAKRDLIPILNLITSLERKTNIEKEKLDELKLQFRKLSQAVGIINEKSGILDHTR